MTSFNSETYVHLYQPQMTVNNLAAKGSAAACAAVAYHPVRTVGVRMLGRLPFTWSLYSGLGTSLAASHQLVSMAWMNDWLRRRFQKEGQLTVGQETVVGAMAGLASTPTALPFEQITVRRQLGLPKCLWYQAFRGFVPMAVRQMGLGVAMFPLPDILFQKIKERFPDETCSHEEFVKIGSRFLSGCLGAASTQVPEQARIHMQRDLNKPLLDAVKTAATEMTSARGMQIFGLRLVVVAVATTTMNYALPIFHSLFCGGGA